MLELSWNKLLMVLFVGAAPFDHIVCDNRWDQPNSVKQFPDSNSSCINNLILTCFTILSHVSLCCWPKTFLLFAAPEARTSGKHKRQRMTSSLQMVPDVGEQNLTKKTNKRQAKKYKRERKCRQKAGTERGNRVGGAIMVPAGEEKAGWSRVLKFEMHERRVCCLTGHACFVHKIQFHILLPLLWGRITKDGNWNFTLGKSQFTAVFVYARDIRGYGWRAGSCGAVGVTWSWRMTVL